MQTRERRISSFVEPGTDAPRPVAKKERKTSALGVIRQPPDADPAPEFGDQPSGWYETSLQLEEYTLQTREVRVSSFVDAGSDLPRPAAKLEGLHIARQGTLNAQRPDADPQPLYSDQPDGWFATTLRIKEHPGVETREQRIASITEAGSDKPRPLIGKTERKSSAVAVARQPPDADPAPGFSDQPSGWYTTSMQIEDL